MAKSYAPFAFDVVILGSGAAGLACALDLPEHLSVAVRSKNAVGGSTPWAQGGIAAVVESTDSLEEHIQDTLIAGAGLCEEQAVRHTWNPVKTASTGWLSKAPTLMNPTESSI